MARCWRRWRDRHQGDLSLCPPRPHRTHKPHCCPGNSLQTDQVRLRTKTSNQRKKERFLLFRFGNGQFACLLLCLTITDLTSSSLGLLGGLVLELRDLAWPGTSQSCAAYYFSTSWLLVRYLHQNIQHLQHLLTNKFYQFTS